MRPAATIGFVLYFGPCCRPAGHALQFSSSALTAARAANSPVLSAVAASGCVVQPERSGIEAGIDAGLVPPRGFIAAAMDLAVVSSAQRYGELVADLAAECLKLRKPKMMGVRGLTAADQARLFGDEPDMVLVPNATRLGQGERALVDAARSRLLVRLACRRLERRRRTGRIGRR